MVFKGKLMLLFVGFIFFASCDKKYELDINGEKLSKDFKFVCGSVHITAYSMFRNTIFIKHRYDHTSQALFYKDSLQIKYNGNVIPFKIYDKDGEIKTSVIELKNEVDYEIISKINDTMPLFNDGDKITITDNGYLYCGDYRVNIDTIELTIRL